jgi:hypothetical protein
MLGRIKVDLNATNHGLAVQAPKFANAMNTNRERPHMSGLAGLPHSMPQRHEIPLRILASSPLIVNQIVITNYSADFSSAA